MERLHTHIIYKSWSTVYDLQSPMFVSIASLCLSSRSWRYGKESIRHRVTFECALIRIYTRLGACKLFTFRVILSSLVSALVGAGVSLGFFKVKKSSLKTTQNSHIPSGSHIQYYFRSEKFAYFPSATKRIMHYAEIIFKLSTQYI